MRKLTALRYSVLKDGPIVGYGPYLRYRQGLALGRTAPIQLVARYKWREVPFAAPLAGEFLRPGGRT